MKHILKSLTDYGRVWCLYHKYLLIVRFQSILYKFVRFINRHARRCLLKLYDTAISEKEKRV